MAEDLTSVDFFRDGRLTDDPYPFYEALRDKCPVSREDHYGVTMVTGWQEAVDVYNDAETFSSCISVTGPFPGFPVPLEGDDVTELIEKHRDELPFSDQLPTLDPPTHTDHRALLMRLITPKRLKENEDAMWRLADDMLDEFLAPGEGEFIKGFAGPFTLLVIADLLGVPEEDRDEFLERLARGTHGGGVGNADKTLTKTPLEYLYEVVRDVRRGPPARAPRRRADRAGDGDVPRRLDARGRRRRAGRHQPLLGRPGDHGPAARHRAEGDRRQPRHPAAGCARTAACSRTSSRSACASRARSRATSGCRGCRRPSASEASAPAPR